MIEALKNKFRKKPRFLHRNIEFLLKKFSLDIKSLSLQTDVPIATLVRMKKEDTNPTISTIEPIADFFRLDINDLLYADISSDAYQAKSRVGSVQYVSVINLADVKEWPMSFESKIIIGTVGNLNEGTFGICIDTDSMSPIFYKNSIIIVDPAIKPKDGDYVFSMLDKDKIPVIRQFFIDGSNFFFKPLNANYGGLVSVKEFNLIGVVVKSIENYR